MGGGIILLGFMALFIPEGYKVVAIHGMVQLFSNSVRVFVFRKHIKYNILNKFFIGASIGVAISIVIVIIMIYCFNVDSGEQIKIEFLKPVIGIFIVWFLFFKKYNFIKNKSFAYVGIIAGLFSIFVGAIGPFIAPFFLKKDLSRQDIIANKAAAQIFTHISKIPIFIYFFNINYFTEIKIIAPLILAVYVGTYFGKIFLKNIKEKSFRKLFRIILFFLALRLINNY